MIYFLLGLGILFAIIHIHRLESELLVECVQTYFDAHANDEGVEWIVLPVCPTAECNMAVMKYPNGRLVIVRD